MKTNEQKRREELEEIERRLIEHRKKNFAVEVKAANRPLFPDEITLSITTSGNMWVSVSLLPSEAEAVIAALKKAIKKPTP